MYKQNRIKNRTKSSQICTLKLWRKATNHRNKVKLSYFWKSARVQAKNRCVCAYVSFETNSFMNILFLVNSHWCFDVFVWLIWMLLVMLLALFEYYVFCFTTDDEQTTQNNITYKNEQMLFLYKWMMENMIQITHKKISHML